LQHVWTPRWEQEESFGIDIACSRALTCIRPLMQRSTCREPVWEFADRVQFRAACSGHIVAIWFSRSRLIDRYAISSI